MSLACFYYLGIGVAQNLEMCVNVIRQSIRSGLNGEHFNDLEEGLKKSSFAIEEKIEKILCFVKSILVMLDSQKVKKGDENNILSHFSKFDTFNKIYNASDKEYKIRLSHIKYANDPMESLAFYEALNRGGGRIDKKNTKTYPIYASFCSTQDTAKLDILPLWQCYGDDAKGMCMVFNVDDFISNDSGHAMVRATSNSMASDDGFDGADASVIAKPRLYKVIYLEKGAENEQIENIKKAFLQLEETEQQVMSSLFEEISHLIKYDTYEHEQEYRLLYFANKEDVKEGTLQLSDEGRVFMECTLPKLREVMRGAKTSIEEEVSVQYILDKRGLEDVDNTLSSIAYR